MAFVESAWRSDRHSTHGCTIAPRHAGQLFRRHSVTCTHQTVETVSAFRRVDVSIRQNRHGLRRIVTRRVEVGEIVGLGVDRLPKLITHAEYEIELAIDFPTVRDERFGLREPEKTHRIEI